MLPWEIRKRQEFFFIFIFFLICIYTHIVKQVTKHLWILYTIRRNYRWYPAPVFQIRIRKLKFGWRVRNRTREEEEQNKLSCGVDRSMEPLSTHSVSVRLMTDRGQNTVWEAFIYLAEVHLSSQDRRSSVESDVWLQVCPTAPIGNMNSNQRDRSIRVKPELRERLPVHLLAEH